MGLFFAPGGRPLPLFALFYSLISIGSATLILFLLPFGRPLPLFPAKGIFSSTYFLIKDAGILGLFLLPFGLPLPLFIFPLRAECNC